MSLTSGVACILEGGAVSPCSPVHVPAPGAEACPHMRPLLAAAAHLLRLRHRTIEPPISSHALTGAPSCSSSPSRALLNLGLRTAPAGRNSRRSTCSRAPRRGRRGGRPRARPGRPRGEGRRGDVVAAAAAARLLRDGWLRMWSHAPTREEDMDDIGVHCLVSTNLTFDLF
jgi:hypothetical protein